MTVYLTIKQILQYQEIFLVITRINKLLQKLLYFRIIKILIKSKRNKINQFKEHLSLVQVSKIHNRKNNKNLLAYLLETLHYLAKPTLQLYKLKNLKIQLKFKVKTLSIQLRKLDNK